MKKPTRIKRVPAQEMPAHLPAGAYQQLEQRLNQDVQLQVYAHRSTEQSLIIPAVAEPLLVLVLAGSAQVEERGAGQDWTVNTVSADDFFLTMSPEPYEMRWTTDPGQDFQVVHVYLSQRLLDIAAQDVLGGQANALRLRDVSGARDAHVAQLIRCLHQEMSRCQLASSLYVQGIAQALAVHLMRHYRDDQAALKPVNALPAYKLHRVIERMGRALENEFSLTTLAAEAGMSDFYFSRMFRRATGQSPSQYFIQLRIDRARELLLGSALSVMDIGLEVGYSSPSHFSQVFRRHTGVTPKQYRQG